MSDRNDMLKSLIFFSIIMLQIKKDITKVQLRRELGIVPGMMSRLNKIEDIKVLQGLNGKHGLPESARSSEAYIKLKPDGTFHEMRFYAKDHVLYPEIGYHAEKSLTGDNHTPVLHCHLYDSRFSKNKDGAFDRSNARRLTDEMKNKYKKYFKGVTNYD